MRILLLSPEPLLKVRGSPIAVSRMLQALSDRGEHVDVVSYHEGRDINYKRIRHYRIPNIPFVRNIQPGFSWKKLVADFAMFFKILKLLSRNDYDLVHAVEEAVFFALLFKYLFKIPYVYDMDSSLSRQMIEQLPWLAPFSSVLDFFQGIAVKNATAIVAVCDAIADDIAKHDPKKVVVLYDFSLLEDSSSQEGEDLKAQVGGAEPILMYVGNLQPYQGVDLLLESFTLAVKDTKIGRLVIVGGTTKDINKYQEKVRELEIGARVHFLGPKPLEQLGSYLSQADVLVSPRTRGYNTPMKIFSYLSSGKPVLATNILSHTQALSGQAAILAEPRSEEFARAITTLVSDRELRLRVGLAGQQLVQEKYSHAVFLNLLNDLYDGLQAEIEQQKVSPSSEAVLPAERDQLRPTRVIGQSPEIE